MWDYEFRELSWMCEGIVQTNPGFVIKLTHSSEGNFQQLFNAHAISIQGFAMGFRPIIIIDSSYISGPFCGALSSALRMTLMIVCSH